jgi:hypothetical protein
VRDGGQMATPAKPYATHTVERGRVQTRTKTGAKTKAGYVVSQAYADKLGMAQTRFESSAQMHAAGGVRFGTFRATGGMWEGLQVRNFGDGAVIEFAGVSLGKASYPPNITFRTGRLLDVTEQETKRRAAAAASGRTVRKDRDLFEVDGKIMRHERAARRDKKGNVIKRKTAQMIRNWQKAGVVFKHSRVNVIQSTDRETLDMIDGFGASLYDATRVLIAEAGLMQEPLNLSALAERFHRALTGA